MKDDQVNMDVTSAVIEIIAIISKASYRTNPSGVIRGLMHSDSQSTALFATIRGTYNLQFYCSVDLMLLDNI